MAYGGVSDIEVNVTYATPEYFSRAFPPRLLDRYAPETAFVFVITESTHTNDLPDGLPAMTLNTSLGTQTPELLEERVTSPHHRVTIVRFDGASPKEVGVGPVSLEFLEGQTFAWALPIAYDRTGSLSPFGVTWASLFAIMAGLIAAMWPCLLQLTVFFIPSLAGLSMEEVSKSVVVVQRFQVVKAALFFILGFTVVYTLAGGLIGFAAQELGESANFETIQRYIGIGGGIIILLLALRVAVKVRAPLVCKMPILSRMGKRGSAKPWEMMLAGLAFATGCMTCFGAALVISMVVYVGLSGSAFFGALILFLFSLGMGIPLLIGALLMTKLLPMLGRMEKWVNRLGLASALLMVGFAILLISGNYMVLYEWAYGAFGIPSVP
jgi:cytochrome c-type biogenesis protein